MRGLRTLIVKVRTVSSVQDAGCELQSVSVQGSECMRRLYSACAECRVHVQIVECMCKVQSACAACRPHVLSVKCVCRVWGACAKGRDKPCCTEYSQPCATVKCDYYLKALSRGQGEEGILILAIISAECDVALSVTYEECYVALSMTYEECDVALSMTSAMCDVAL
jgi:hypothetical protein